MSKKVLKGEVVSNKMQKTVVVAVKVNKRHPIYRKHVKSACRYKARDEIGVPVGATVLIEEHSPFSKEVTWLVKEVISEE